MTSYPDRQALWLQVVAQIQAEYLALDVADQNWIKDASNRIAEIQEQLDGLFQGGDGIRKCADCQGDCCALGHNHMTLANLLLFLVDDLELPRMEFSSTCPLLGPQGCLLPANLRPYNCISFLCDRIEDSLSESEVDRFYQLEKELRSLYRAFAERYAGGSMSGLLVAARRLDGDAFLQRIDI